MTGIESREDVARREVGHTDVSAGVARALAAGFLCFMTALPVGELAGARGNEAGAWTRLADLPREVSAIVGRAKGSVFWDRVVPANRAVLAALTAFESAIEDQSPVGRRLRPPTQLVLSGALGAGNERVYVGRDGWLFYRPDVEYVTGPGFLDPRRMARRRAGAREFEAPPAPDPLPAIRQLARDLAARGIALVLMPTPVKPTLHPDRLAAVSGDEPLQNASYAALVADLRRDGILIFDPAPVIAAWQREFATPAYLATDTHWRPETMHRVAEALAGFLRTHVGLPPVPSPGYVTEPRQARQHGDTAAMLDLPEHQTLFVPETVTLRFVLDRDRDPWRASRDADVLLLGDSFTNVFSLATMGWGEAAGFAEQLSVALDRPVDRIVQNDRGASATRLALARETAGAVDRLAGKRVVVWQFAARELAIGDWIVLTTPDRR